ncbi:glutamine ABC transporter substrate-binding protein [Fructilactobacillus lindneri]|uniref:ABC transporter glutamine-binding protein glnH n=2 Tax=Fructilactobacillus lindneri TaxID=53444 RepID=A0A0R2JVJ7_9LACO|nr:transporter substrate-binding domain-containing protein [Fructilactobacillus lindneri]ANZ57573.1 glutamine ABC transporter substrate-binding protein [Fructilactobacillus lindneri]ANZ58842.1 glutamine ABC transporter substrate-binding protein [Fructilactobacillus lindneri]KRN78237.1 ABC transporter glutamine-binding protein glnH [Fructilactobacillus lindneri DSM 20690 = JCM 11027]POG97725.1 glutamine ABC transporter substrate-binding protein [Fructilactobacillus lindneri]POH00051.1 glutamine
MSKAKLKRMGLFASVILVIILIGGVMLGINARERQNKETDALSQIKQTHVMRWGVKCDTRLFGLISPKTEQSEGFDVDIARAITKQIAKDNHTHIKSEFTPVTTNSKIQLLKNKQVDAVAASMTITPERAKIVDFSKPYFPAGQSILVKKNSGIKNIKDLNNSKSTVIGVMGTTALETTKKFAPKAHLIAMPDNSQAFSALESAQGQAMTTDNAILYGFTQQSNNVEVVGKPFTNQPYGLGVDKGQTQLNNAVNKALAEIIKDGTYNRLIKKWFSNIPGLDWRDLTK